MLWALSRLAYERGGGTIVSNKPRSGDILAGRTIALSSSSVRKRIDKSGSSTLARMTSW